MLPVRAILFDADGVIQHGCGGDLASRVQRALGFVPEPLEHFLQDVLEAERPALAGQAELLERLQPVLHRWGAGGKERELAEAWWRCIQPDPAVFSLIEKLRQEGLLCALATNQQSYRADFMRAQLGYDARFDHSFYSCELGCAKPEPSYFEAIVGRLAIPPEQLLFIDDLEANVAAARGVGLQAAQFVHPRTPDAVTQLEALLRSFSVLVPE